MVAVQFAFLAAYAVALVFVSVISFKRTKTLDDFQLAGRNVGPWLSAFAYGTTYFSAVIFIGYAGKLGWSFGMATVWIGIGNAVIGSYLAWKVLGNRHPRLHPGGWGFPPCRSSLWRGITAAG